MTALSFVIFVAAALIRRVRSLTASFLCLTPKTTSTLRGSNPINHPIHSSATPKTPYKTHIALPRIKPPSETPKKASGRREREPRDGRARRQAHRLGGLHLPRQRHPPLVRPRHHRRKPPLAPSLVAEKTGPILAAASQGEACWRVPPILPPSCRSGGGGKFWSGMCVTRGGSQLLPGELWGLRFLGSLQSRTANSVTLWSDFYQLNHLPFHCGATAAPKQNKPIIRSSHVCVVFRIRTQQITGVDWSFGQEKHRSEEEIARTEVGRENRVTFSVGVLFRCPLQDGYMGLYWRPDHRPDRPHTETANDS
jgi:hypothetical protein